MTKLAAADLDSAAEIISLSSAFIGDALGQQQQAIGNINRTAESTKHSASVVASSLQEILALARRSEGAALDVTGASQSVQMVAERLQQAAGNLKRDLAA